MGSLLVPKGNIVAGVVHPNSVAICSHIFPSELPDCKKHIGLLVTGALNAAGVALLENPRARY